MNTFLGFGMLILVIINFIIFHKFVSTFYTDFVRGCATELFWIVIFTAFEMAIIRGIILKILGALASVLGFVGKLILFVVIVAVVIFVVWKIAQIVMSKIGTEKSVNPAKNEQDTSEGNVPDARENICKNCGKPIKKGSKCCQYCGSKMENDI